MGLQNRRVRSAFSSVVAALLVTTISYLGVHTYQDSHAASGPSLYLSPSSSSVQSGSTVSVSVREDSGGDAVNSVQASLNYDSNELQFVSLTEGGSFPIIAATSTNVPGIIRIGRGVDHGLSGDNPVATINFKVIGGTGTAALSFDRSTSVLARDSDSSDILQSVGSGSFAVTGQATTSGSPTASTTTPSGVTASDTPPTSSSAKPVLYINPSGGSFNVGATISAAVRLNAGSTGVTTVEAAIGYPSNLLQYTGTTEGGIYTTAQRTKDSGGVVDIIRGVSGGSTGVSGDKPVVTLNFKVLSTASAAQLTIAGASAVFDATGSGNSILDQGASAGASYSLVASGGSNGTTTTSASASKSNLSSLTTPAQAALIGTSGNSGHIALTKDADGSVITELSGEVELAPVIDPDVFAHNPGEGIAKVEYYIDGKLVSTQKSAPYTYKLDTKAYRNGTYTMVVKTYFTSGTADTRTDKLLVKNKVDLSYVLRNYIANIIVLIIILALLGGVIWKLVIPRFGHGGGDGFDSNADHDVMYGFRDSSGRGRNAPPVADDPMVIAPGQAAAPTTPVSEEPVISAAQSAAAMTTAELPMSGVATETIVTPTPAPAAPVSEAIISPAPGQSAPPVTAPSAPADPVASVAQSQRAFTDKYVAAAPRPDYSSAVAAPAPAPSAVSHPSVSARSTEYPPA